MPHPRRFSSMNASSMSYGLLRMVWMGLSSLTPARRISVLTPPRHPGPRNVSLAENKSAQRSPAVPKARNTSVERITRFVVACRYCQPQAQGRVTIYEPEDWAERIRHYYAEQAGRPQRPVLVPTLVLALP
jgi:hypothetical protein